MLRRNFLGLTPAIFSAGFLGFQPQESPSQYTIIKLEFDKIGQEIFTACNPSLKFKYWRNYVEVKQFTMSVIDGTPSTKTSLLQSVPLAPKSDIDRFVKELSKRYPRNSIKFFEIKTPQGENVWAQIS